MSVNNELNKLKNLLGIKKVLIVEGNVDDIYKYKNDYLTINKYITNILNDKKFNQVFSYDQSTGITGELEELTMDEIQGDDYHIDDNDIDYSDNTKIKKMDSKTYFKVLIDNLNRKDEKLFGFITDYTNYLFSENNLLQEERDALVNFNKSLKEKNQELHNNQKLISTSIFITKQVNQITPSFYLENPEVSIIVLPKPNSDERENYINTIYPSLNFKNKSPETIAKLVSATDGWTLKEIGQFAKFTSNYSELKNLDSILSLYIYGEKKSPWEELKYSRMKEVEVELSSQVIGQEEAINKVSQVIRKAYIGLSGVSYSKNKTKPKGTLFFVGPTGVGKTELAKAITKFLFNDESNLIRFDMSEYSQEHSDQKLIGAPPGYVGFKGGGQLTNAVKLKPFSVILFDEIEKAHSSIFDKFLQILEDGRLTDNTGQTINFSETFIIFTSNIGAADIQPSEDKEKIAKQFISKVENKFVADLNRPELLGRFGNNIIPFNFIMDKKIINKLVKLKLVPIIENIYEKYKIKLDTKSFNDEIFSLILKDWNPQRGGRDIVNSLETNFVDRLSDFIFSNLETLKGPTVIKPIIVNNKIDFQIND